MAAAAVCGTSGVASLFFQRALAEESGIADGMTRRFDSLPFCNRWPTCRVSRAAPRDLPPTLANLTPQAYNSIQYDAGHSLWNNIDDRKLDIQFSTSAWLFRRRACSRSDLTNPAGAGDSLPPGTV